MVACKSSLMFVFLMPKHMSTCIYRCVYPIKNLFHVFPPKKINKFGTSMTNLKLAISGCGSGF